MKFIYQRQHSKASNVVFVSIIFHRQNAKCFDLPTSPGGAEPMNVDNASPFAVMAYHN